MTCLSFTTEICVDNIDERNRFPYKLYVSVIIVVIQLILFDLERIYYVHKFALD